MINDILREDIEYIVHCESNGKIIGPISKVHAHMEGPRAVLTHYSTFSMIFNPVIGKYGIQKKNPSKHDKFSGGKWDMGVAGHNPYVKEKNGYRPLDFGENLVKEAAEEIGLELILFENLKDFLKAAKTLKKEAIGFIIDRFHFLTEINNEFVGLGFIITPTTKVDFVDDEVIDFKWLSPGELADYLKNNDDYCSPLPIVFEKAEKFRLKYLENI